jgi:pyruvate dehydrogenase E1 component alpha subunit
MHIADLERGNLGANGVLAAAAIAVGAAHPQDEKNRPYRGCISATDRPTKRFHESLNQASVWKCGAVCIENNQYGISTSSNKAELTIYPCASGIRIPENRSTQRAVLV